MHRAKARVQLVLDISPSFTKLERRDTFFTAKFMEDETARARGSPPFNSAGSTTARHYLAYIRDAEQQTNKQTSDVLLRINGPFHPTSARLGIFVKYLTNHYNAILLCFAHFVLHSDFAF